MSRPWWLIPCALLGLTCGEGGGYGVDYDGTWIPVIDMHLHPGDWDAIPPETQTFLASRFPFPLNLRPDRTADQVLSATGIVGELDRGGVHVGVLFAVYAPRTVGVATNELVEAGVAEYPKRLLGFASLRVDDWASAGEGELDRLEEELERLRDAVAAGSAEATIAEELERRVAEAERIAAARAEEVA
ncbi:MAG: hypothetical protein KC420_20275, partial [Myxococcales bacterium]|nr:hypothetical protein [Myxococcales bacterium]